MDNQKRSVMQPTTVFSSKAEKYARYRWDYAPQAVQEIFDRAGLSGRSSVADVGAGTGILSRHFLGRVGQVFAVEPNPEMRAIAQKALGSHPACQIIDGQAESTTLPDHCVDLVSVAQAINWFDPQPARAEFVRILKPGGRLAILRNYGDHPNLNQALASIYPQATDTAGIMKGRDTPFRFYFGSDDYFKQTYRSVRRETWEEFFGALCSASYAPDEGSPLFARFERAARAVYDRFSMGGTVEYTLVTELNLGQISP